MAVGSWPETFVAKQMVVTDGTQYVRLGGKGPAVVLLHGFGDTGDMWVPLADALVKDHAAVVPDLRGMGLSSHPEGGYEKVAQAPDLAAILDQLGFQHVAVVTHDIGNMVGYAFAALFPQRATKWVAMDAPLPGIGRSASSTDRVTVRRLPSVRSCRLGETHSSTPRAHPGAPCLQGEVLTSARPSL